MGKRLSIWVVVLSLVLFSGCSKAWRGGLPEPPVNSVRTGIDAGLAARLDDFALAGMEKWHSPGLGVGVVIGDTLVYAGYLGFMDLEAGRPVTPDTIFRIGSISKSITTVGLLQKWEKGAFDLDREVNDFLPEEMIHSPDPGKPVTFRHLLTHTSGGGEFLSFRQLLMKGQGAQVEGADYKPLYEYLKLGFHNKVEPGVKYAYSNYGYSFLGLALETMAGEPFHRHMQKSVFRPLGMTETTYRHTADMEPDIITGYKYLEEDDQYRARAHRAFGITPSGNVYTTVRDFALYVTALLNGGANQNGRVIKLGTLKMMMTRQQCYDPRQTGYGFGLRIYGDNIWGEHRIIGHSGSVPFGYTAMMLLAPDRRTGVYVLANCDSPAAKNVAWGVLKLVLGASEPKLKPAGPSPRVWPELEGLYGPEYRDFKTSTRIYMSGIGTYRVAMEGDRLMIFGTWEGKDKARELYQVYEDDPYFYRIECEECPVPEYISFIEEQGSVYIVPGGYERFVRLGPQREVKAYAILPLGRVVAEVNPF